MVAERFFAAQGQLNSLLSTVGLGFISTNFLAGQRTALLAVALTFVFSMIGTNTIIFLTGMATLDHNLAEASRVDGASGWQTFRWITVPQLKRFIQFALMMTLISAFTALFSLIFVMTSGGPGYGSTTLEFFVYQTAFETGRFGTGRDARRDPVCDHGERRPRPGSAAEDQRVSAVAPSADSLPAQVTELRARPAGPCAAACCWLLMIVIAIVMLYPFWFMIDNSFKSQSAFIGSGGHSLTSWRALDSALPWGQQMKNSTIVCLLSIAIILVCSTMAGFAFAKLRFPGASVIFAAIIAAILIPVQSIVIPAYVDIAHWHLLTSYWGAVLMYSAIGTPFATFLMTVYYRSLPDELIEAGVMDGLSYPMIFVRLALPLSMPAMATVFVLQFIQIWDDLLIGLLFLQNQSDRTITVGLGALAAGRTTDIPVLMAGSLISAIPAIIVFLIFQRFLVNGLTAGIGR